MGDGLWHLPLWSTTGAVMVDVKMSITCIQMPLDMVEARVELVQEICKP